MKLKLSEEKTDNFVKSEDSFCIDKEYNMYEVWESENIHIVFSCMLGKMKAVIKDGNFLGWVYPLTYSPSPYTLITKEEISHWKKIIDIIE